MHRDAARRLHQGVLYCRVSHVLTVRRIAVFAFTALSTVGLSVCRLSKTRNSSTALRGGVVYRTAPNVDTEYVTYALQFIPSPSKVCVIPPISTKFILGQQHFVRNCCT